MSNDHKPIWRYRNGVPTTVECSCGVKFTRQDTDTEYAWHLIAVQGDLAEKLRKASEKRRAHNRSAPAAVLIGLIDNECSVPVIIGDGMLEVMEECRILAGAHGMEIRAGNGLVVCEIGNGPEAFRATDLFIIRAWLQGWKAARDADAAAITDLYGGESS